MKKNFICTKKSVRTFKLRIEPYFLSHAERGESLQNQAFVGGMQNRRRFAPTIFLVQKPFSKICGGYRIRTCKGFLPLVFETSALAVLPTLRFPTGRTVPIGSPVIL